jgi:hypothetical protein
MESASIETERRVEQKLWDRVTIQICFIFLTNLCIEKC